MSIDSKWSVVVTYENYNIVEYHFNTRKDARDRVKLLKSFKDVLGIFNIRIYQNTYHLLTYNSISTVVIKKTLTH